MNLGPLTKLIFGRRAMESFFIKKGGRYLMYPRWIFGTGMIINQHQKVQFEKNHLMFFEIFFWILCSFVPIGAFIMLNYNYYVFFGIFLAVLGVLHGCYEIMIRKVLAGAEITSQRMTFNDHVNQVLSTLTWPRIIVSFIAGVFMNFLPGFIVIFGLIDINVIEIIFLGISQIFLLFLLVFEIYLIKRKLKE